MPKPICPECEGEQVLYRIKSDTYICRRCGQTWPKVPAKLITRAKKIMRNSKKIMGVKG